MSLMSLYRASKNVWLPGEMQRKVILISVGEQLGCVPGYGGPPVRIKGWLEIRWWCGFSSLGLGTSSRTQLNEFEGEPGWHQSGKH